MKKFLLACLMCILPMTNSTAELVTQNNDLISSETKINYTQLQQLLKNQQWKQANHKTYDLMLQAIKREDVGWIDFDSYKQFPCTDLRIIDQIWQGASKGKFGFSAQLPIFIETGNKPGRLINDESFNKFGDQVGWRKNGDWIFFTGNLTYNIDAPKGHLPRPVSEYLLEGGRIQYNTLTARIVECNIVNNLNPSP